MQKLKVVLIVGSAMMLAIRAAHADSTYEPAVRCFNVASADVAPLAAAVAGDGLKLQDAGKKDELGSPAIVLWEARQSDEPSEERIKEIGEYVRTGGRLIMTVGNAPGTGAFRFKSICPTTAWRTLLSVAHRGGAFPAVDAGEWDATMFPDADKLSLHLPYYFPLRPFDVAERGMQRYERFDKKGVYDNGPAQPAGDQGFTRPLLNRDWQIRVRANDIGDSGLLLTGQYGAGRVAVFASAASAGNAAMWGPLVKWLDAERPPHPIESSSNSAISITATHVDAAKRELDVELANSGEQAAHVEVIGRVMTWEHALIGDVIHAVDIAPNAKATVALDIVQPDPKQFQAIDAQDAFIVDLGALTDGGSTLISERNETVDLRPIVRTSVALDDLRQLPAPFKDVPGVNGQDRSTPSRMGEPVTNYAYPPGTDVNVTATVSNGRVNLAPLATVTDETQPANPSIVALNDQVQPGNRTPLDGIAAYGVWMGQAGVDNSVLFTFPSAIHVSDVIITGNTPGKRDAIHNPAEVVVEANDKVIGDVKDFDAQLVSQSCAVHVRASNVEATTVRVKLPWSTTLVDGKKRAAPWIGEIEIHGYAGDAPSAVSGKLTLTLSDAAAKSQQVLVTQDVQLQGGDEKAIALKIPASAITTDASTARFFKVAAQFTAGNVNSLATTTLMTIDPTNPLQPIGSIHPGDGPILSFVVTRGFRNASSIGTGTREAKSAWETADDLVWAYERQLKQIGGGDRGTAKKFFVTDMDFAHYCAPWSIYPNGQVFMDLAAPHFVEREEKEENWKDAKIAQLGFGDRWDTGPAASLLYSWEELAAFDDFLQSQKLPRLTGHTREELVAEVKAKYDNRYSAWHMARYAQSVKTLSSAFAEAGKKLIMSGQGTPLVPDQYQEAIASVIQGMSDDTTWGMSQEDIPQTTGRQMATLAFNPVWKMNYVMVWGYDSAVLNNGHWHASVGCTESSRRHYSDSGWRGLIDPSGQYRFDSSYGYGMNAGVSWCMSLNDYQEAYRMQERLELISPDAPLGVGLVIGNASWNDPQHATFSGGGMGGSPADSVTEGVASACGSLYDLRIPVAFSTNISALANWKANTPIVVLNLPALSAGEVKILKSLHDRGVRIIGFGGDQLPPGAAEIFGVTTDGTAAGAKPVGTAMDKPVMATDSTMFVNIPFEHFAPSDLQSVAQAMRDMLSADVQFPDGTAGYGFVRGKQRFIIVEDWREEGRDVNIKLRASAGSTSATAINVNDHVPVEIAKDADQWNIKFATRPGDGTLLCVEEK